MRERAGVGAGAGTGVGEGVGVGERARAQGAGGDQSRQSVYASPSEDYTRVYLSHIHKCERV